MTRAIALLALVFEAVTAGQGPRFDPQVPNLAFQAGQGPRVLWDGGHFNEHHWGMPAFLDVLRKDGFRVSFHSARWSSASLDGADIIVVPGPLAVDRDGLIAKGLDHYWWSDEGRQEAFTSDEVLAVTAWVRAGGSLLLILDHAPAPAAARRLLEALGVDARNSMTWDDGRRPPGYNYTDNRRASNILFSEFWRWLKADYRAMLDLAPAADGVVLTFIETGARAERQHSKTLTTAQDKLAAVVNAVADVVIGERKLALYARTFSYGAPAVAPVKAACRNAFDIVTSMLYTLGTNTANHSKLDYDPYASSYARSVTGKWLEPPVVFVRHGVNREFHHWKDVVDRLAPHWAKSPKSASQLQEVPWVVEHGWLRAGDQMDAEFLRYVDAEKAFGVRLAGQSLRAIDDAKPLLREQDFIELRHYFARTLLTARLHRAVANAYFGFRVYARGDAFRTATLMATVREALLDIPGIAREIREYPVKPATGGQWNWVEDADVAMRYYDAIARTGWPAQTSGVANPYGGLTFPLAQR